MTSAGGLWQCHGWLGLVRSIASSFKPILGPSSSSSSGLSLPSRVFSLTVGNARAHSRGRFSRADQPTTGPSVVVGGRGRRARSQCPARRAPLPKITGCLSSSPARGLTNRREREREREGPQVGANARFGAPPLQINQLCAPLQLSGFRTIFAHFFLSYI